MVKAVPERELRVQQRSKSGGSVASGARYVYCDIGGAMGGRIGSGEGSDGWSPACNICVERLCVARRPVASVVEVFC
tara:strand:+ start:384 stop:614 length:231 start_codon:yes stop_codon:yes gene_type:complete